jgi:hypothetical protein
MENHFLQSLDNDQGPHTHLRIQLKLIEHDVERPSNIRERDVLYFSLATAVRDVLLDTSLQRLDPFLAEVDDSLIYYQRMIYNYYTGTEYASLINSRPGHENRHPGVPGMFLYTDQDSNWLRAMTGLPFPDNLHLDDPQFIPLALYNKEFDMILPTRIYEDLIKAASHQRKLEQDALGALATGYQLIFKGKYETGDQTMGKGYVAQHFYDNAHEPGKALLTTPLPLLDPFTDSVGVDRLHTYAYVKASQDERLAAINVMSIHDAIDGDPTAGIYIDAQPDIGTFEKTTGLDLSKGGWYDPGLNMYLLAPYKYDFGYKLSYDEGVAKSITEWQPSNKLEVSSPMSIYSVSMDYVFLPVSFDKWNHHNVLQTFHHRHIEQALLQLLQAPWPLMGLSPAQAEGHSLFYYLEQAAIQQDDGLSLAYLMRREKDAKQEVVLVLAPILYQYMPKTFDAIWDLIPTHDIEQDVRGRVIFTLATAPLGEFELTPTAWAATVMERVQDAVIQIHNANKVQPTHTLPAIQQDVFIQMEWSGARPEGEQRTYSIPQADLQTAHQFLLQMDPKLFVADSYDSSKPYLLRAFLSQGENLPPMVTRFYQNDGVDNLAAGYYIQYNQDHPVGLQLSARVPASELIEHASSPHVHTYRQQVSVLPQWTPPPRQFLDNEGRDAHPSMGV